MNEIEIIISSEKLKGDFLMCNKVKGKFRLFS